MSGGLADGLGVEGGDGVPVHDIPEGGDVVGAAVLVVEVVGVFPDVEAEDGGAFATGDGFAHDGGVLVGGGGDGEFAVEDDEPCPAGTEAGGGGFREFGFEVIEAAEGGVDGSGERAGGETAFTGAEDGPEERVVYVTAGVVADGGADSVGDSGEVADEGVGGFGFEVRVGGEGVIEIGDVRLVVFAVVDFHGARIDVGFEGVVGVGESWESVGHDGERK